MLYIVIVSNLDNLPVFRTKGINRVGPHPSDILSIIHGSLLGDAHAEKRDKGVGTRVCFHQEDTHKEYAFYLHKLLSEAGYCNSKVPSTTTRLGNKGKLRSVVRFSTWTYTSFNFLRDEWYQEDKKHVPMNIDKYLTPLALAVWIMDDGCKVNKGLKLCTNSFTFEECNRLVSVLYNNFGLKATVQSAGANDQYIIYVWKESMPKLLDIVSPFIIAEMKYKVI